MIRILITRSVVVVVVVVAAWRNGSLFRLGLDEWVGRYMGWFWEPVMDETHCRWGTYIHFFPFLVILLFNLC